MWYHPKHSDGQLYAGSYDYDKKGKRYFELIESKIGKRKKRIPFSSPKAAKDSGWKKL